MLKAPKEVKSAREPQMLKAPKPKEVKAARELLGLTQKEAAAIIGYEWLAWSRYESGGRDMSANDWTLWRHLAGLERIPFKAAPATVD